MACHVGDKHYHPPTCRDMSASRESEVERPQKAIIRCEPSPTRRNTDQCSIAHTHTYIYIYTYMYRERECVCVCVFAHICAEVYLLMRNSIVNKPSV